ncbi:MAG: TonB family protein [bacterium]|nr:TonB family protein [bacterium]
MKKINETQVCFLISLIAHIGLIGASAFNFNPIKQEKPFDVEFEVEEEILPERYEVKNDKKIEKPIREKKEVVEPVTEESAAEVISKPKKIDDELKNSLLRYQDSIKQKIQKEKQYPRWALRAGHEGDARIAFSVLSSGQIKDLKLLKSSGFDELDKEALAAVKRASPFLSFPDVFTDDIIDIELDIVFHIMVRSKEAI